jgi:hypothetical protein
LRRDIATHLCVAGMSCKNVVQICGDLELISKQ